MNPGEEDKEPEVFDTDDPRRNQRKEAIARAHDEIAGLTLEEQEGLYQRALRDSKLGR